MLNLLIGFALGSVFALCAPRLYRIASKALNKQLDNLEDKAS